MQKVDLKKQYKEYYLPKTTPQLVTVPEFNFLMIDGSGSPGPGNLQFSAAIEALFSVSYKLKFALKKNKAIDYGVMPLEGLWWAEDMEDFIRGNRDRWLWTLMIMQPEWISQTMVDEAIEEVEKKKNLAELTKLRFESFNEGRVAQIMHIGPFSEEHGNILKLHGLIEHINGKFDGKKQKHHEIYLNDFRRVNPEKMKTVLRQPYIE